MTLDKLIREYLIEVGETNLNKYARFLQYAISGLREFNIDFSGVPTLVALPVNANGTVDLPTDYVSYIRIAVCDGDGNLHSLGYNPNMCIGVDFDKCGNVQANEGADNIGFIWSDNTSHVRNGQLTGGYFGAGGNFNDNGYYRIDEKNNYIVLQNFSGDVLVLEYLSDLSRNSEGNYVVHPYLVEALKSWVQWKASERNTKAALGQRQLNYQDYNRAKSIAQRRMGSFTVDEAKQIVRKNFMLSPKF
jgi:hypothetical protein